MNADFIDLRNAMTDECPIDTVLATTRLLVFGNE